MTHIIKLTNATKGGPEHVYLNAAHRDVQPLQAVPYDRREHVGHHAG